MVNLFHNIMHATCKLKITFSLEVHINMDNVASQYLHSS